MFQVPNLYDVASNRVTAGSAGTCLDLGSPLTWPAPAPRKRRQPRRYRSAALERGRSVRSAAAKLLRNTIAYYWV